MNNHSKVFAVKDEYNVIEQFIERNKCSKPMHRVKACLKIKSYIWNYYNLASAYQYAFLLEMEEAFKRERRAGHLCVDDWEERIWKDINEIIDNRDSYFHRTGKYYVNYRLNNMSADQNYEIYLFGIKQKLKGASEIWLHCDGEIDDKRKALEGKGIKINMILVSDKLRYPDILEGLPIVETQTIRPSGVDTLILIRTSEENSYHVKDFLQEQGFGNVLVWDDTFEKCLAEKW